MRYVEKEIRGPGRGIYNKIVSLFGQKEGEAFYRKWYHSHNDWIYWTITIHIVHIVRELEITE